jgi:hypothetical protein
MAHPGITFVARLRRHGAESAANRKQLQDWKAEALADLAENKGGDILSGSGNGVSFAKSLGGGVMTNKDWFEVLDDALQYLDAGLTPSSRTYGRIV